MPQVFVVQLLFLYRYIFVLADEVDRAARARELRSCGKRGQGLSSFGSLTGHLLLRTCQRAERIHMAMLSRGFTGEINVYSASRFGLPELRFVVCWLTLFMFLRLQNVPQLLGTFITGLVP